MKNHSQENLKPIRFAGELLPDWAQLFDLAAGICGLPTASRQWFSKFTTHSAVDDARTVLEHCTALRTSIEQRREVLLAELQRNYDDAQPPKILAAWLYSLDTMIQEARTRKTCSWIIEGMEDTVMGDFDDGGDITLRRV